MAEGAVSFLIGKLGLLISQEASFLGRVETQITSLREELEWISSFLRDADEKRRRNERVNVWVNQVRNLAFDAEDIIDLFIFEVQRQRQRNIGLRFLGYPKHLFNLHKFGNQIEDIKRRIAEISANKSKYGIETLEAGGTSSRLNDGIAWKVRRASMEEEVDVVGFDQDIETLAKLLIKQDPQARKLLVLPIVGMGGSGKTTLARSIYNKSYVKNSFDSYAWIYVSEEFRIKDLLLDVITQVMMPTDLEKEKLKKENEDELREKLSNCLKERRCLFVFDDVWKIEDWDIIKMAFLSHLDKRKQQRVLLTSRKVEVAKYADPSTDPHELKPLDGEKSFELFSKKIFPSQSVSDQQRSYSDDLKDLAQKLVAKCDGLPLAIVVLGGLLATKEKTYDVWSKVSASVEWQLSQGPHKCMDILALSYIDLPYYLQSCFLYFGLFPEDHEISSSKLIQIWIAEGFIEQRGDETLEDVAEDYLQELIDRSMIQAVRRRANGVVELCRIHDLLRDLAISESKKDKLLEIYGSNNSTSLNRFRQLVIDIKYNGMHNPNNYNSALPHLHSLLCFSQGLRKEQWKGLYLGFNLLRVMDLEGLNTLDSLPKEIGGLVLLKYLNLKRTNIRRIPESLGNLCNLQSLDLSYTNMTEIPKVIWRMHRLRHLVYVYCQSPSDSVECVDKVVNKIGESCCRPPRIDNLSDLQTLYLEEGSWIEDGLEKLTNLRDIWIRGELTLHTKTIADSIANFKKLQVLHLCEDYSSANTARLALPSISHLVNLYRLILGGSLEKIPALEDFPPYLVKLGLYGSYLQQHTQPMATLEKLPNLKSLHLGPASFLGKEMICSSGGFAKLQDLEVDDLPYLEHFKVEKGALASLKILIIFRCRQLKMIPDGLQHVTTLQEIRIGEMPEEFNARFQEDTGEDWKKMKHISPSINFHRRY